MFRPDRLVTSTNSAICSILALLMLSGGCAKTSHPAPQSSTHAVASRKPNIIFILADDLGYGDLGCYGQKRIKTPNIDRLANQGVRFTQFYAGDTVCTPSRCCLMTGLHTGHCNERGNGDESNPINQPTMPQILKSAGYATAAMGKWGIGEPGTPNVPTNQGFDYFFGYLDNVHAHNYYPSFLWRNNEKVKLENIVPNEKPNGGGVSSNKAQYSNDLFTKEALSYIDQHKEQPFFLYMPYTIPHANDEAGKHGTEVPSLGQYANENWPDVEKGFAAMVTRLDSYVGQIMAKLKADGLDDNTIIVFTSDNGPHKEGGHDPAFFDDWGPLRGFKRDMFEGGIREPMIVRWPGHTHPHTTSDYIGGFQDFLPTFAQVAGAPQPQRTDGLVFVPAIEGDLRHQPRHAYLYWEFYERQTSQAVRAGDWKAIRIPMLTGRTQLYNLKTDLHEDHDVAAQHPDEVNALEEMMNEAHTAHPNPSQRRQARP